MLNMFIAFDRRVVEGDNIKQVNSMTTLQGQVNSRTHVLTSTVFPGPLRFGYYTKMKKHVLNSNKVNRNKFLSIYH